MCQWHTASLTNDAEQAKWEPNQTLERDACVAYPDKQAPFSAQAKDTLPVIAMVLIRYTTAQVSTPDGLGLNMQPKQ